MAERTSSSKFSRWGAGFRVWGNKVEVVDWVGIANVIYLILRVKCGVTSPFLTHSPSPATSDVACKVLPLTLSSPG